MVTKKKFVSKPAKLINSAKFDTTLLKIEYLKGYIAGLKLAKNMVANNEIDYELVDRQLDWNVDISERQIKKYKNKLEEKGK